MIVPRRLYKWCGYTAVFSGEVWPTDTIIGRYAYSELIGGEAPVLMAFSLGLVRVGLFCLTSCLRPVR